MMIHVGSSRIDEVQTDYQRLTKRSQNVRFQDSSTRRLSLLLIIFPFSVEQL